MTKLYSFWLFLSIFHTQNKGVHLYHLPICSTEVGGENSWYCEPYSQEVMNPMNLNATIQKAVDGLKNGSAHLAGIHYIYNVLINLYSSYFVIVHHHPYWFRLSFHIFTLLIFTHSKCDIVKCSNLNWSIKLCQISFCLTLTNKFNSLCKRQKIYISCQKLRNNLWFLGLFPF